MTLKPSPAASAKPSAAAPSIKQAFNNADAWEALRAALLEDSRAVNLNRNNQNVTTQADLDAIDDALDQHKYSVVPQAVLAPANVPAAILASLPAQISASTSAPVSAPMPVSAPAPTIPSITNTPPLDDTAGHANTVLLPGMSAIPTTATINQPIQPKFSMIWRPSMSAAVFTPSNIKTYDTAAYGKPTAGPAPEPTAAIPIIAPPVVAANISSATHHLTSTIQRLESAITITSLAARRVENAEEEGMGGEMEGNQAAGRAEREVAVMSIRLAVEMVKVAVGEVKIARELVKEG